MDVTIVDYYANHGKSFLHKAGAACKIIFTALVIASIITTNELYILLGIYLALVTLVVWTSLPVIKIITIAAYPAVFALIFAFAVWNGNWTRAGVIILKALSAALAMVLLIVTTPYPDVFNTLRPFLPKIIAEAMFVTYRSIFILLELTDELIKALRVRGGITKRKYLTNIKNFSSGIGLLLVKGFDFSEKFYGMMNVRGYGGRISGRSAKKVVGSGDILAVLIGLIIFGLTITASLKKEYLYLGGYILVFSLAALVISAIYRQIAN